MVFRVGPLDRWASKFASQYLRPGVAEAVAPRSTRPPKHDLILYDFEASPWCRLVREYATILDLTLTIKPCPRETVLFGEGSFGPNSKYRLEAMNWHNEKIRNHSTDTENNLTFPLLIDVTNQSMGEKDDDSAVVAKGESYDILEHLWEHYGGSVLPNHPRPDQIANAPQTSFATRFFSLAGPSYLRPWPRCGLLRFPTRSSPPQTTRLTLYQAENCPKSRLVREALCSLQISYTSVPVAKGSFNTLPCPGRIPVLSVQDKSDSSSSLEHMIGAESCLQYLHDNYWDPASRQPTWFDPLPNPNLGRSDGPNFSVFTAAASAIQKGQRAFVPDRAMK